VLARVIGDVDVVGTGLGEVIVETWDTLLFSASLVVAMALYDLPLAAMALLPVPIALLLAKAAGRRITVRTVAARRANASVTSYISEHLAGIRTVRAFGPDERRRPCVAPPGRPACRRRTGGDRAQRAPPAGVRDPHRLRRRRRPVARGPAGDRWAP
jgi:ABC-type multidrug transport system fused ATPase/permease subunit